MHIYIYRFYADLIDLTKPMSDESDESEMDDLPPVCLNLTDTIPKYTYILDAF